MFRSTFKLGHVRGIELGVNWSWLFVFGLITWSLAAGVFPATNPGLGAGVYVAMALVAALMFFASILLHELGHALQAAREGMQIEGITLWIFGGVAKFSGMFPSAGAEFRIAIAGPAVTLAIAAVTLGLAGALPLPGAIDGVLAWLGMVNAVLLAFNMLPAFPLDGGRVLRAALWARTHDFSRATHVAGAVGRGFGQVLIGLGVLATLLTGAIGGLWFAFIGWFLTVAARSETQLVTLRESFAGMTVADLMVRDVVAVNAELTLDQFARLVASRRPYNAYPVLGADGRVVGILPVRLVQATPSTRMHTTSVASAMVAIDRALTMDPSKPLPDAVTELVQTDLGRALVLRDGALVGLLSVTDVQRALDLRMRPRPPAATPTHGSA